MVHICIYIHIFSTDALLSDPSDDTNREISVADDTNRDMSAAEDTNREVSAPIAVASGDDVKMEDPSGVSSATYFDL